jgi:hypothetical protein
MKNVHVLPTDKQSRIYLIKSNNKLGITSNNPEFTENFGSGTQNQHIYITSDEEIKEGDWFLTDDKRVEKCASDWRAREWHKKIILTTDVDLIADGVQAIDDDFLEWFVKNPSCESVEVLYEPKNFLDTKQGWEYLIVSKILKEEPTLEEEYLKDELKKYEGIGVVVLNKPEEPKQETAVQYLKRMRDTYGFITTNDFKRADEMFERQIEKSFMKNLPIEDGVITSVQKAEQYYNETFNK